MYKASILTVGDEILIGQVVDTNSAWIGKELSAIGAEIGEIRSVRDERHAIVEGLSQLINGENDLILITGGLGPTKDDITKKTIAETFGDTLAFDQKTYDHIAMVLAKFNKTPGESHRLQAYMPINATHLSNQMGTAPGMMWVEGKTSIVSMPGVPYEMQAIMTDHILPLVKSKIPPGQSRYSRTIMTAGEGETTIEDKIAHIVEAMPSELSVAYLPSLGTVRVRVTGRGQSRDNLQKLVDATVSEIAKEIPDIIYGYDDEKMVAALQRLCISKNIKVATAESCTGGLVSHMITSQPGSSAYYMGGVVSYDNNLKQMLLGVNPSTLEQYGAVSEETVIEMAQGAAARLGVDVAVSISGIAGPTGGTPTKPVGLIWICVASKEDYFAFKINASKDREKNIEYAANQAINALRRFISKHF